MINDEFIKTAFWFQKEQNGKKSLTKHLLKARKPHMYTFTSGDKGSGDYESISVRLDKNSIEDLIDIIPENTIQKYLNMPPNQAKESIEKYISENDSFLVKNLMQMMTGAINNIF
jgi:hypothetical protein